MRTQANPDARTKRNLKSRLWYVLRFKAATANVLLIARTSAEESVRAG